MIGNQNFNYNMESHTGMIPYFFSGECGSFVNNFAPSFENCPFFQVIPIWNPLEEVTRPEHNMLKEK